MQFIPLSSYTGRGSMVLPVQRHWDLSRSGERDREEAGGVGERREQRKMQIALKDNSVFHNLGLICVILTIVPVGNDIAVLTKLIARISNGS